MNFKKYLLFILLPIFFVIGCECITSINTPVIVTPSLKAHVLFCNSSPDFDDLNIYTQTTGFIKRSTFYDENILPYSEINPGTVNINLKNQKDSIIYNGFINLNISQYYTYIIYGNQTRVEGLILSDQIQAYDKNNCYFRFVNVSTDTPMVMFILSDKYPIYRNPVYRNSTGFEPAYASNNYSLNIRGALNDSLYASLNNITFNAGKTYTFVYEGFPNGKSYHALQIRMIETTYPIP